MVVTCLGCQDREPSTADRIREIVASGMPSTEKGKAIGKLLEVGTSCEEIERLLGPAEAWWGPGVGDGGAYMYRQYSLCLELDSDGKLVSVEYLSSFSVLI